MEFRYLGPLEVLDAGQPLPLGGPKQRLVLAHLLIDAERTVPVERLIDRVWGDEPPAAARTSVHSYVSNLRRLVGTDRIVSRGQGYAFDVDGTRIDRLEFDELLPAAGGCCPPIPWRPRSCCARRLGCGAGRRSPTCPTSARSPGRSPA